MATQINPNFCPSCGQKVCSLENGRGKVKVKFCPWCGQDLALFLSQTEVPSPAYRKANGKLKPMVVAGNSHACRICGKRFASLTGVRMHLVHAKACRKAVQKKAHVRTMPVEDLLKVGATKAA